MKQNGMFDTKSARNNLRRANQSQSAYLSDALEDKHNNRGSYSSAPQSRNPSRKNSVVSDVGSSSSSGDSSPEPSRNSSRGSSSSSGDSSPEPSKNNNRR